MIFYCDLQGNLKAFQNETVYQGSNNVTTIYVVAPFNRPVGLNISFTKPNKLVTSPAIMKWVGTLGNVKIPVSFVNIPEQFTDTYNVWAYALPYSITEQNGVVGVSVNAVIADSVDASGNQAYKGNLTTFTGQFTVAYSALPSPPTDIPTEWTQDKVLDLLNNYYNDAIQKIGEMNTLKTDAKDTLVKAINEVFDEIANTNATIGDLSTLTTDEKTTIVGAINEVDAHTDTAQQTADNATELANTGISKAEQAQATANSAVNTANEAKTTAQTAENNANSAVDKADNAIDRANKAYEKAANNVYAVGFMTLQEAITAVNGYDNTVLKTNDNILVVAQGSPDLYVTSVEATNIPYNFTTVDKFNDDLVKNTVLQIGYYKVAFYETDGQPVTVAYQNVVVKSTDWVASTEFADFPYEAKIELTDFVDYTTVPQVVFDIADTMSGNYAPICKSGDKCVYIYSKVQNEITLKTVITFAPNVNGASVTGGGYNNRGKWVASTTYAIDDLVYTDNGQYVCIEGITSTTSPEQDTTHWRASFVVTAGTTKNVLKFVGRNKNDTNVLMAFDGAMEQYVSFNKDAFIVEKTIDDVLEISVKGTVPKALPQEASALKNGNLPTSGWNADYSADVFRGTYTNNGSYPDNFYEIPNANTPTNASKLYITFDNNVTKEENGTYYGSIPGWQYTGILGPNGKGCSFRLKDDGIVLAALNGNTITRLASYPISDKTIYNYTISDTSITANSDILMELTDEGGVKAYSMEAGKMTVIRDTVPTRAIPYTYKVKQTNASGQFTLVNHYVPEVPVTSVNGQTGAVTIAVPTKTSDLTNDSGFVKPTEANTFTGEQTFSNENGIKTNRVHNLNDNVWYDFDGTNDRLGSLATPTIIRTSEARPKAEVPSGSATVTKEIALLEDVRSVGDWIIVDDETPQATITEAGTYQVVADHLVVSGSEQITQKWSGEIYFDSLHKARGTSSISYSASSEPNHSLSVYTYTPVITSTNNAFLLRVESLLYIIRDTTFTAESIGYVKFKYRKIN
nr:MAG TPA: major outer membrane lipoprotein [Caudoviricetes sp.]